MNDVYTIHNRYAMIERVMLTVSSWYKIHWKEMYRPNVRGKAATARLVAYNIVKTISRHGVMDILALTKGVVNAMRGKPLPTEYETIKGIVTSTSS